MFKKAVIEKHGKLHGALGEELSHALQLREREGARAHKSQVERVDVVISVDRRNENSGKRGGGIVRRETSGSGRVESQHPSVACQLPPVKGCL